jgi:ATP-dependent DNA ligase
VHEVKFDGYRVRAHKLGNKVVILSRNGHGIVASQILEMISASR